MAVGHPLAGRKHGDAARSSVRTHKSSSDSTDGANLRAECSLMLPYRWIHAVMADNHRNPDGLAPIIVRIVRCQWPWTFRHDMHEIRIAASLPHEVGPSVQMGDELVEEITNRQTIDGRCSDTRAAPGPPLNSKLRHHGPAILNRH